MSTHATYLRAHAVRSRPAVRSKILEAAECIEHLQSEIKDTVKDTDNLRERCRTLSNELQRVWRAVGEPGDDGGSSQFHHAIYFDDEKTPARLHSAINRAQEMRDVAQARQVRLESCIKALYQIARDSEMEAAIKVVGLMEGIELAPGDESR